MQEPASHSNFCRPVVDGVLAELNSEEPGRFAPLQAKRQEEQHCVHQNQKYNHGDEQPDGSLNNPIAKFISTGAIDQADACGQR